MMGFLVFFLFFMFFLFFFDLFYLFSLFFFSMFVFFILGSGMLGMLFLSSGSLFCIDWLSFYLILLSFWVFSMVFLVGGYDDFGGFMIFMLFWFLSFSFLVSNVFWFYFFFECSMVPIFFLIMGWGSGEDRLFSAFYMFIYTLVSSLPFLVIIMLLNWFYGICSFDYFFYSLLNFNSMITFFLVFVFMVKMPVFVFHIWLPKAHVDAPVYGSMVLASVMLKLGGYGLLRLLNMCGWVLGIMDFFYSLSICGLVYISLVCLFSVDMKVIAAYSSVVHMGLMVCGILSGCNLGYVGGFFMILSHGICSSGLFMMINMLYSRSFSRLLFFNKGFFGSLPLFSYLWLFMIMDNIGAPPSLSYFSEVYCLSSMFSYFFFSCFFIFLGFFIMSCVTMNLFFYGFGEGLIKISNGLVLVDYFLVFFHLFSLNCFGWFIGYLF